MANNKQRYINTRFWNDNFVSELNPIDKLLFIYFLTNEHTNISGIYELPIKIMSVETGIENSMIKKMLPRLSPKVRYIDGKVIIKNFVKHQETKSYNIVKGIQNCLDELDKKWLENIINKGYYIPDTDGIDTPYIPPIGVSNYSNSNLDSNSNSIAEDKSSKKFTTLGADVLKAFEEVDPKNKTYYNNKTQRGACDFLVEEYGFEKVMKVVAILPKSNLLQYMPVVTTPVQLREKWTQLEAGLRKKKSESEANKNNLII